MYLWTIKLIFCDLLFIHLSEYIAKDLSLFCLEHGLPLFQFQCCVNWTVYFSVVMIVTKQKLQIGNRQWPTHFRDQATRSGLPTHRLRTLGMKPKTYSAGCQPTTLSTWLSWTLYQCFVELLLSGGCSDGDVPTPHGRPETGSRDPEAQSSGRGLLIFFSRSTS